MLDQVVRRVLFVRPAAPAHETYSTRKAENAFTLSFFFTGVRCILQYALLPFALPILGIAGRAAVPITLAITVIAIVAMVISLRHLWSINYKRKWEYLGLAAFSLIVMFTFLVMDLRLL